MRRHAVLLAGFLAAAPAMAADAPVPINPDSVAPFDLSGTWRVNLALSDQPPAPPPGGGAPPGSGGPGGGGGGGHHGGWGGGGGGGYGGGHHGGGHGGPPGGGPPPGAGGTNASAPRGAGRLPDLVTIKQLSSGGIVNLADSTGATLVEVTVNGSAPDTAGMGGHVVVLPGKWKDGALQVQRPSWRGSTLTQFLTVEEDGERLVVRTHMDTGGVTPPTDVKRVYDRVGN